MNIYVVISLESYDNPLYGSHGICKSLEEAKTYVYEAQKDRLNFEVEQYGIDEAHSVMVLRAIKEFMHSYTGDKSLIIPGYEGAWVIRPHTL